MASSGRKRGGIPWRLVAAQSRVGVASLALAMLIVAVAVFLTAAVPVYADEATSRQLKEDVTAAGARANVVVAVPLTSSEGVGFGLYPDTADSSAYVRDRIVDGMPSGLGAVLGEPVTTLTGPALKAGVAQGMPLRVRFAYVAQGDSSIVTWVEGRPPASTGTPLDVAKHFEKLPVEVGLSSTVATALSLRPGDTIPALDPDEGPLTVTVTGIFQPVSGSQQAFSTVPTLLNPQVSHGGEPRIDVAALTTADSLPAARLAVFSSDMDRLYTYFPNPAAITAANAADVETLARGLASGKEAFDIIGADPRVDTSLDRIVATTLQRSDAAAAQASVLLLSVVALVALTQVLAASVLVAQRSRTLRQVRDRGSTAVSVGVALLVESLVVAGVGAAAGLVLQSVIAPGEVSVWWVLPPVLVAALSAPVLGMRLAARPAVPPPAASKKRGFLRSLGTNGAALRRVTAEVIVVLGALVSVAALRARGTAASSGGILADLLVLAAPVLCALAVGALTARVLPLATRWLRTVAAGSTAVAPLVAMARVRAAVLPTLAFVLAASTIAFSASIALTAQDGVQRAASDNVGADAAAVATYLSGIPAEVGNLHGQGMAVATASDLGAGYLAGGPRSQSVTIVAVDAVALAEIDPAGAESWNALAAGAEGDALAMLESGDLTAVTNGTITWGRDAAPVTRVGGAPSLPGTQIADGGLVVVDRAALEAVTGKAYPLTAAWAVGDAAVTALTDAVEDTDTTLTTRAGWLANATGSPVAAAMTALFIGTALVSLASAALAVFLLVAAGARERRHAMARLRVVGLSATRVARVARAEIAVPVTIASAVGIAGGFGVTWLLVRALNLSALTRETHAPTPTFAWWALATPLVLAAVAWAAVWGSGRHGRTERLSQVMRIS